MVTEPFLLAWADARAHVGVGHVVRSLALVQAWLDRAGPAMLLLGEPSDTARDLTSHPGIDCREVGLDLAPFTSDGGDALGRYARSVGGSWVSIDSYSTTATAQRAVRGHGLRLAVVDDHTMTSPYDADLLIDQNLGAGDGPAPQGVGRRLAGVRYAMLRRQFRDVPLGRERAPRLVICLGGTPTAEMVALGWSVARAVEAHVPVDLVLGGSRLPDGAGPEGGSGRITVHHVAAAPWELFHRATVALSPAGSTAWELCVSGVALVLIAAADNQVPVGQALADHGAAVFAGRAGDKTTEQMVAEVNRLLADDGVRARTATKAQSLIDGHGARRVATVMRSADIGVRHANIEDMKRYFDWANDPVVRAASFDQSFIAWPDHQRWFTDRLARSDCELFVATNTDLPVGQIRFDLAGPLAEIGVSLAPEARGRGIGAAVIVAGTEALRRLDRGVSTVRARVRIENVASARAFVDADFDPATTHDASNELAFTYDMRSNR